MLHNYNLLIRIGLVIMGYVNMSKLLSTCNLSLMMVIGGSHMLEALHIGPFKPVKTFTSSYELELPMHIKIHLVFHMSQLNLYKALEDSRR